MKVFKSSKVTILHPEILSLTLGLFWAVFVVITTCVAIAAKDSGESLRSVSLIQLFQGIYPWYRPAPIGILWGLIWGFINGYLMGFFIGWIYTRLRMGEVRKVKDFVFKFDNSNNKKVSVIQDQTSNHPYTITFVANPVIYLTSFMVTQQSLNELTPLVSPDVISGLETIKDTKIKGRAEFLKLLKTELSEAQIDSYGSVILDHSYYYDENETFELDPIIEDKEFFCRTVVRCLRSFVNNELLGLPEILNRLKIVAVFDDNRKAKKSENALCEEMNPSTNILAARLSLSDNDFIEEYLNGLVDKSDVIFVISASENLIQSSALFTEDDNAKGGKDFKYTFSKDLDHLDTRRYAYFPKTPGIVAFSALEDRLKIPTHEFAHAMSSLENGAIVDEYLDEYNAYWESLLQNNIINRKSRATSSDAIPDIFAKYQFSGNGVVKNEVVEYFSDRDRRDKDADWVSYVPERSSCQLSCTMDIEYYGHRFDKLIFDFMYDRLITKLNRP